MEVGVHNQRHEGKPDGADDIRSDEQSPMFGDVRKKTAPFRRRVFGSGGGLAHGGQLPSSPVAMMPAKVVLNPPNSPIIM